MKKTIYLILSSCMCLLLTSSIIAQTTVRGVVSDANEAIIGANVTIAGTTTGTVTDYDGSFELTSSQPLPWDLEISYVGYATQTISVTDASSSVTVTMEEEGILGAEVVVSASRRKEKVQEAPASISVISARKLAVSANSTDPTRNLVSTPGVQIQQQSANRINVSMRGGAGLFGTSAFPIMDYRSLVGPGIGVFDTNMSGLSQLDLERIEVVRGPGSALYGPGVTQGVIHFITKSPIDRPGTTVELMGGELNTFGVAARHATKVNDKFGIKVNAFYRRGDEFTLDPNNSSDSLQIANMTTNGVFTPAVSDDGFVDLTQTPTQVLTQSQLDPDGDGNPMQDFWNNMGMNTTFEFRPTNDLSVNLSGGVTSGSTVFYNEQGEGLNQSTEVWGQARTQWKGLFAQFFAVNNNGGTDEKPTFLYQTGNVSPIGRTQLEGQLQYNFDIKGFLNSNWTVGTDYRFASQDTRNLVYGRNEQDDDYSVVGGYIQGKLSPIKKLDVVVAARYDRFNFIDEGAFAPRLAVVYKVNPTNTIRASFNRSNSTVSNLQLNIDFPLSRLPFANSDIWLYGNKTEQTFTNPVLTSFIGGPDTPITESGDPAFGLPLAVALGAVNDLVLQGIEAQATGTPLEALYPVLENILTNLDPTQMGFVGDYFGYNIFNGTPLGIVDAPISKISVEDTYEVGYKGFLMEKLGVMLDVYHITERNNSQFTAISPTYRLQNYESLPQDLADAVLAQAEPQVAAILDAQGLGAFTPVVVDAILQGYLAGGAGFSANITDAELGNESIPLGTVMTDQVPNNGFTHVAAGYRTFDKRSYLGADFGLEYYFTEDITAFFNYSWVSETQFMQKVVGVGTELPTYLNIPQNKLRLGANYTPEFGFRGSIIYQWDQSYYADAGQFTGDTGARNLVDASVGYKFKWGLALDVSANNLLNNEYRYLTNMPFIGRRVLGKVTYTFPMKETN